MAGPVSALHERPDQFSPTPRLAPGRLGNQRHVDHARSSPCAKLWSPLAKCRLLITTLGRLRPGVARGIVIFQRMSLKSTLENNIFIWTDPLGSNSLDGDQLKRG